MNENDKTMGRDMLTYLLRLPIKDRIATIKNYKGENERVWKLFIDNPSYKDFITHRILNPPSTEDLQKIEELLKLRSQSKAKDEEYHKFKLSSYQVQQKTDLLGINNNMNIMNLIRQRTQKLEAETKQLSDVAHKALMSSQSHIRYLVRSKEDLIYSAENLIQTQEREAQSRQAFATQLCENAYRMKQLGAQGPQESPEQYELLRKREFEFSLKWLSDDSLPIPSEKTVVLKPNTTENAQFQILIDSLQKQVVELQKQVSELQEQQPQQQQHTHIQHNICTYVGCVKSVKTPGLCSKHIPVCIMKQCYNKQQHFGLCKKHNRTEVKSEVEFEVKSEMEY